MMSACTRATPSTNTSVLDDEIAALAFQLEEIATFNEKGKGKYAVDSPPDSIVAYDGFRAQLEDYQHFLADQQLARSIGSAVYLDGPVIAELTTEEIRSHDDRRVALQISTEQPGFEKPPRALRNEQRGSIQDWMSAVSEARYAASIIDFSDDDTETEAGPSMTFAERQASVLGQLFAKVKCAVCHDRHHVASVVTLPCSDRYCIKCLKELFKRATKDETLFPVRCCKKEIPLDLIAKHMSADELASFETAQLEFSTADRVYCSNRNCAKFIPPTLCEAGTNRAKCSDCESLTCTICKGSFHRGQDCPDDPALRGTHALARDLGWQTCYRCKSVVQLRSGCNHMTCRCSAQFCYECGVQWKKCRCPNTNPDRLLERAEEVVNRDAPVDMPQAERRRRVQALLPELEENHECEHPGRFERVFHGGRRGFQCEMCDTRHWKYILRCRRCHIDVCEDCRRNRI